MIQVSSSTLQSHAYGSNHDEKSISSLELAGLLSQFGIPAPYTVTAL